MRSKRRSEVDETIANEPEVALIVGGGPGISSEPRAAVTNFTFSAFAVGQNAARVMLKLDERDGHKGTTLFTNASAAFKGFARSGACAAASHGKKGLAQSMARSAIRGDARFSQYVFWCLGNLGPGWARISSRRLLARFGDQFLECPTKYAWSDWWSPSADAAARESRVRPGC